jgi:hypothetical protein
LAQQVSAMQLTLNSLANEKKSQGKKGSGGGSEMTSKQLTELKSGIIQEVTKGVGNLVLSSLEEHSAEAVAKILGSEQWREEVSALFLSPLTPLSSRLKSRVTCELSWLRSSRRPPRTPSATRSKTISDRPS